jgi:ribosome biogenesis GTPase
LQGIVYKSTGSWYSIEDDKHTKWNARIKGKLKIDEAISSTNPIAVGDQILFDIEEEETQTAIIKEVKERHNYIVRVSPHNKNQKHIIAANVDWAIVIATITSPRTSTGFIDRFLITAEAYHIPVAIVINKIDLLNKKQQEQLAEWKELYTAAGYPFFTITTQDAATIAPLREMLHNKTTLFSGHSGVGKSTLINQLIPELNIKTLEVSDWSGKGQHTTTFAEMHKLPLGGKIIDTPGVKEFGLIAIEKEELAHFFPEMRQRMNACKFNNCLHINEPDCAIKKAVNEGTISVDRYANYLTIMDTIEKSW